MTSVALKVWQMEFAYFSHHCKEKFMYGFVNHFTSFSIGLPEALDKEFTQYV